ncbi:MAG: hypothetical protein Q8P41_13800 [Pseudomonadota bacterium]|nr:hypothetical protein [Pseudomonadota bacterium]
MPPPLIVALIVLALAIYVWPLAWLATEGWCVATRKDPRPIAI